LLCPEHHHVAISFPPSQRQRTAVPRAARQTRAVMVTAVMAARTALGPASTLTGGRRISATTTLSQRRRTAVPRAARETQAVNRSCPAGAAVFQVGPVPLYSKCTCAHRPRAAVVWRTCPRLGHRALGHTRSSPRPYTKSCFVSLSSASVSHPCRRTQQRRLVADVTESGNELVACANRTTRARSRKKRSDERWALNPRDSDCLVERWHCHVWLLPSSFVFSTGSTCGGGE
jgi:hypothetical protein